MTSSKRYQITTITGGQDMGIYEGETERDAVESMWRAAGYRAPFDAMDADGVSLCDADDLSVVEVQ